MPFLPMRAMSVRRLAALLGFAGSGWLMVGVAGPG